MFVTKRMCILKVFEIGEIVEENAERRHILKMIEFADFAEKNPIEGAEGFQRIASQAL